jgi:hypothetical protein
VSRFLVELHFPGGVRREIHVTDGSHPTVGSSPLRDGGTVRLYGISWNVTADADSPDDAFVLRPVGAATTTDG